MDSPSALRSSGAVVATNRNMRIKSWNAAAERAYGWTSGQAVGKNLDDLLCTAYAGMSAEQAYAALFARGRLEAEASHTARDGRQLRARCALSLTRDGSGRVTGVLHAFRPLAGEESAFQGEAGAAAPLSGERGEPFPGLPEDSPGDVWIYDIASGGEWHARRRAPGPDGGEPAGAVHPDDSTEAGRVIREAVKAGRESFSVQCRAAAEGGGYAWTLTQGCISYEGSGKPSRIYGATVDISELKAMEEELGRRARELERREADFAERSRQAAGFFTDVSHDFKTPLSIMLVNLQMMEYCLSDLGGDMNKRLLRAVAMMRQNTLRLLRLSGNLLDVTRLDAGFMKARLVNADVVEIASGLTASVANHAAGRGVEVTFECALSSRVMPTDGEKLERILLNLLSNAVKHTPPGGHVRVKLEDASGSVRLTVSDDGSGMPEDVAETLRERFRRGYAHASQAGRPGLGLLLARALVELLRGRLWFESRQGEGSSFFVELPVLQADWQALPPESDGMTRDRKVEMEFSDIETIS